MGWPTKDGAGTSRLLWMAICAAVNLAIAGVFAALGSLPAAAAWLGGLLLFFPFFVSLRQVLEHRSEEADSDVDYRDVDHGAVNRLFGDIVKVTPTSKVVGDMALYMISSGITAADVDFALDVLDRALTRAGG